MLLSSATEFETRFAASLRVRGVPRDAMRCMLVPVQISGTGPDRLSPCHLLSYRVCAAGEDQGDRLCCTSSRSSTACQEQRPICLASRTSPRHSVCSSSSLRVLPLSPRHARQHAHCRTVPVEPDFCRRAEWGLGLHAGGFETSILPVHATEHHRPSPPPRCHVRLPCTNNLYIGAQQTPFLIRSVQRTQDGSWTLTGVGKEFFHS